MNHLLQKLILVEQLRRLRWSWILCVFIKTKNLGPRQISAPQHSTIGLYSCFAEDGSWEIDQMSPLLYSSGQKTYLWPSRPLPELYLDLSLPKINNFLFTFLSLSIDMTIILISLPEISENYINSVLCSV